MPDRITPPTHDETQEVRGNPRGTKGPHFGNEYDSHDHRSPADVRVGQGDGGTAAEPLRTTHTAGEAIPDGNGARGWIDQKTGAVHGSGMGAGGGQPGEDLDQDAGGDNSEQGAEHEAEQHRG